jgi:outer membrane usher protein
MPWLRTIHACRQLLSLALVLGSFSTGAIAGVGDICELQLEVYVNDAPTHLIGSFTMVVGGRIAARRAELEEIGLKPHGHESPDTMIVLDELAGLSYRYAEANQQIFIAAPDELRAAKELAGTPAPKDEIALRSGYGGVLNYTLFSAGSGQWAPGSLLFSGSSATLDARVFSPFGTLSQSAILRTAFNNRFDALRLDTAFSYSDRETLTTYRAGDAINGGLAWTRPIRIGGLQAQRSFGLRPDLVTLPLPSASGSAAVPSTVDVFVNNVRTSSQEVESGPYRISNLSATTGSGNARVVLRDASGRETVTDLPFYVSSKMLAPGLFDFSAEAGAPRLSYGTTADTYGKTFVASASGRRGVLDWLTLEGHAEAGAGLWNAGAGAVIRTGSFGVASGALAASDYGGKLGLQSYVAYETGIWGLTVQLSSQRSFGPYDDLASVTARLLTNTGRSAEFGGRVLFHQPGMDSRYRPHVVVAQRPSSQGTRPNLDRLALAVRPLDSQRKLHPPRRCLGQGLKRSVRILVAGVCVQCHRLRHRLHGRQRPQELRISGWPFDPDRGSGIGILRRLKGQERHQFDLRRSQAACSAARQLRLACA